MTPAHLPTAPDLRRWRRLLLAPLAAALLGACGTYPGWLPTSGPSLEQVGDAQGAEASGIRVLDVSDGLVRQMLAHRQRASTFSEAFGTGSVPGYAVGSGDVLEVTVWEAPPASLFGTSQIDSARAGTSAARAAALPAQTVNSAGQINIPFVGAVQAAGRKPEQIEQEIERRLKGKANQPQVLVRVLENVSSNVTVVGEVAGSRRVPLTAKGERLLDALAAAGGVRQPVGKITLQLTRAGDAAAGQPARVQSLPLEAVIADPSQNVVLQPGDVLTALHQPYSLTILGATARNQELDFEAQGITLAQALARAGGLNDQRADARGVFVFRFEDPALLGLARDDASLRLTPEGKLPVVYKVDLRDPASFFVAQDFPMQRRDVMYVANAPAAELAKFLSMVSSVVLPTITIQNATQ